MSIATVATTTATEKQIAFIKSLHEGRELGTLSPEKLVALRNVIDGSLTIPRSSASACIEELKSLPHRQRTAANTEAAGEPVEGMHQLDGVIYKVQRAVHASGHLYAKQLVVTEPDCGGCANGEPCEVPCKPTVSFVFAKGVIRKLSKATLMTLEEAKAFGALYGTCVRCGRTLTAEDSIDRMMGPVCFGKMEEQQS